MKRNETDISWLHEDFFVSFLYKTKMISLAKVTKTKDFAFSS